MGHVIDSESWPEDRRLAEQAAPLLASLRAALAGYQRGRRADLDRAFAAAAAAIAVLRANRARTPADAAEARSLMARLPEFEQLVFAAAGEAERSASREAGRIWAWFGLSSRPPQWDEPERSGARLLVACACAPLDERGPGWLRAQIVRLAAQRWAAVLTEELRAADESVWQHALGDRYETVRHRYAPRTRWRKRTLAAVLRSDPTTVAALRRRLGRWLAAGGNLAGLRDELEAAFVETRNPPVMA